MQAQHQRQVFGDAGAGIGVCCRLAQLRFGARQVAGQHQRQAVIGQRSRPERLEFQRSLIGRLCQLVLAFAVKRGAERGPGFGSLRGNFGRAVERPASGRHIAKGHLDPAEQHQRVGAFWVHDQGARQHVEGAFMAADFAQRAGKFQADRQVFAVLQVFLGPEIGARQGIGAVGRRALLGGGRLHGFLHRQRRLVFRRRGARGGGRSERKG